MRDKDQVRDYVDTYMSETMEIVQTIDRQKIAEAVHLFKELRARQGRLFILGVGGSAGNASHAVNDFRKIANIETYTPTDNVSELTAWINDVSWEGVFQEWLRESRLCEDDMLLIYSVGGGSATTSQNLVLAMEYAKKVDSKIVSIVSRDGGMAKTLSDITILIPVVSTQRITPHAEGWQGLIWHLIVNALVQVKE